MDLNFYSDLTDGTGQHDGDPEFLDPQSFNGFDSDSKVTLFYEWGTRPRDFFLCLNSLKKKLHLNASQCRFCLFLAVYCRKVRKYGGDIRKNQ